MDLEFCSIQMAQNTKGSFDLESKRAMEESFIQMGTSTTGNGLMTELMDMEFSRMHQELDMRENGKWISNMEEEKRFLRKRAQYMKENSSKDRSMGKEFLNGLMEAIIREILLMGSMKEKDYITLQIKEDNMKEIFLIIKCMVTEKKHGKMVENTKEIIETPRKMVLEHSYGQTVTCIKEIGEMISKTVKEYT